MTRYASNLLDKAMKTCSPANYSALALRAGVSRQAISRWRNGLDPLPEERVNQFAQMARVDAAEWWLAVQSDSAPEPMRPKLHALLKKAGIAALIGLLATPAWAGSGRAVGGLSVAELALIAGPISHYAKCCILTTPRCYGSGFAGSASAVGPIAGDSA